MPKWYDNCVVIRAGASSNQNETEIFLTDRSTSPKFSEKAFIAADAVRKELLAIALTAVTSGNRVDALVDDPLTPNTPQSLYALYLRNTST